MDFTYFMFELWVRIRWSAASVWIVTFILTHFYMRDLCRAMESSKGKVMVGLPEAILKWGWLLTLTDFRPGGARLRLRLQNIAWGIERSRGPVFQQFHSKRTTLHRIFKDVEPLLNDFLGSRFPTFPPERTTLHENIGAARFLLL